MRVPLADGSWLHAEDRDGAGAPIVLLHGILRSSASWAGVADALHAAGRRVVTVDDRGHGASPGPVRDWSARAAADDAREALGRIGPAHVVGHSRGGTAASWLAVDAPDLVRSLSVVCSPPEASEVFRAAFRHARAADARSREAHAYLARIPDDDFPTHALRRYQGAALVVEAEDDPLYSPTHTLFWRAYLPYASFERVPGGHAFFERDPAWLAARLLAHVEAAERA